MLIMLAESRSLRRKLVRHPADAGLNEFDFRYSNRKALGIDDTERARRAINGAAGKRLMYQGPRTAGAS
jgi:hypothetical protein